MLNHGNIRNQRDLVVATKMFGLQSPANLRQAQAASISKEPATPDSVPVEAASAMPNVATEVTHDLEPRKKLKLLCRMRSVVRSAFVTHRCG